MQHAASEVPHSTCSSRRVDLSRCFVTLRQAESKRRGASTKEERSRWRSIAQRERRKWKAQLCLSKIHGPKTKRYTPQELRCKGQLITNRQAWTSEIFDTCVSKYCATNESMNMIENAVYQMRQQCRGAPCKHAWDMTVTLQSRAKLKVSTASGGGSRVTSLTQSRR